MGVGGPDTAQDITAGPAYPRTDADHAYLNVAVDGGAYHSLPFADASPLANRPRMVSTRRFPGTDNFTFTYDGDAGMAAALAASTDGDGRPDGAPRESPASGERPPTSWEGMLRGENPRRTTAEAGRYAFDGGLGGRVRGELYARPGDHWATPNRFPPHLEEGINSKVVFVKDVDGDPHPWRRVTTDWARQHASRHWLPAVLARDLEDVSFEVRIPPAVHRRLRGVWYYQLYHLDPWAGLLGGRILSVSSGSASDLDCVLIEAPQRAAPCSSP